MHRKVFSYNLFSIIIIILLSFNLSAQSHNSVFPLAQITYDNLHPNFTESEIFNPSPKISNLWLSWDAGISAKKNIYAKYNSNDSLWSTPFIITSDTIINQYPNIEIFYDSVLIVWESNKRKSFDIVYSTFNGTSWSESKFVTMDSVYNHRPILQIYKEGKEWKVILVWERQGGIQWSIFNGHIWSTPNNILTNVDIAKNPRIKGEYSLPFIVWEGLHDNNWDIYCSWFIPDSSKWISPVRLTYHQAEDRMPSISYADVYYVSVIDQYSGIAYITWQTNRDGNWEIYSGIYWISDGPPMTNVENRSLHDSSDIQAATRLSVDIDLIYPVHVWQSNRSGTKEIYSDDSFFSPSGLVTPDTFYNANPVYSKSFGNQYKYWLAWESYRNEHWEIWGIQAKGIIDKILNPLSETFPNNFQLSQNFPNPFNSSTIIYYDLLLSSNIKLEIFNILGQKVKTLVDGRENAGHHQIVWNGIDDFGKIVSSGIYLYSLQVGNQKQVHKMLLLE